MLFQRLGGQFQQTVTNQREWPVGTARFTQNITKGPVSLLTLSAAVRKREGTTDQPTSVGVIRSAIRSSSFSPDLQLGFRNGLVAVVGLSSTGQRNENNGNATQTDQRDINANMNYAFRLPGSISRLRKSVNASFYALFSKATTCLIRGGVDGCQTISDTRRQELRGGLDTDLLRIMRGGLQFGYTSTTPGT